MDSKINKQIAQNSALEGMQVSKEKQKLIMIWTFHLLFSNNLSTYIQRYESHPDVNPSFSFNGSSCQSRGIDMYIDKRDR